MSEQERLIRTLFRHEGREHIDIKFWRGTSEDITPEQICREANKALFQIDSGLAEADDVFSEPFRQRDVRELIGIA